MQCRVSIADQNNPRFSIRSLLGPSVFNILYIHWKHCALSNCCGAVWGTVDSHSGCCFGAGCRCIPGRFGVASASETQGRKTQLRRFLLRGCDARRAMCFVGIRLCGGQSACWRGWMCFRRTFIAVSQRLTGLDTLAIFLRLLDHMQMVFWHPGGMVWCCFLHVTTAHTHRMPPARALSLRYFTRVGCATEHHEHGAAVGQKLHECTQGFDGQSRV